MITLSNQYYKDTTVSYLHTTPNGTKVYTGRIQTKRGKKNHQVCVYFGEMLQGVRVQEGSTKIDFTLEEFGIA